jgi:hypothetical protein
LLSLRLSTRALNAKITTCVQSSPIICWHFANDLETTCCRLVTVLLQKYDYKTRLVVVSSRHSIIRAYSPKWEIYIQLMSVSSVYLPNANSVHNFNCLKISDFVLLWLSHISDIVSIYWWYTPKLKFTLFNVYIPCRDSVKFWISAFRLKMSKVNLLNCNSISKNLNYYIAQDNLNYKWLRYFEWVGSETYQFDKKYTC